MLVTMWRAVLVLVLIGAVAKAEPISLDALLARTNAVAKEVSKIRGLPLKHEIPNEVVDRAELRGRLVKMASDHKTQTETAAEGFALARWDLIPLDTDYMQMMVDLLTEQIAGYYDAETKKLTISQSAGDDAEWAEMVLAHEIDHGLQDQSFDLHKFEDLPDTEGDAAIARHALVEGDGIALMIEVVLARRHQPPPWSNPEIAARLAKSMAVPTGDSLEKVPLVIREAMMFPYRDGFRFVAALRRRQPWSAIDAVFKRAPRSTEQILHPARYLSDDLPIPIAVTAPAALADYSIVHSTVWGELGFDVFLRSHGVADDVAERAAAGWGGDRAVVLAKPDDKRPDHAVGIARLEWDTEVDAIEAHEAAVRALDDAIVGATIEHTETRTRWLALDGSASWVERRGKSLVIVRGAPSTAADALIAEAWTATTIAPNPKPAQPSK
ncbi:MAG: hypothetical protein JWO36_4902 [Myxococcales bacterium]|nr:hypothetical protein [Myxococcales bacterium]